MIKATNTCSVDTVLQMLYCIWAQNLISHQIIKDCEPILSKLFSPITEENHAYARVLYINDATERKNEILVRLLNKDIVKNKDRSHTEYWDCWSDIWYYMQDHNKLFKTGAFRREYSGWILGPKCPGYQNFVKKSMRDYNNRTLLHNLEDFLIRSPQHAINGFLFEKMYNDESTSSW